MKVFTQDIPVLIDGEWCKPLIGAEVPKKFEKWFETNCMHFVKEVKGGKPKTDDDGARKSPADKMADMAEAKKK